jgi:hypothetical protein
MQMNLFVEGLHLLLPYYDDPEGYHLGAEHDIIYVYATNKPVPEATVKRLIELGFFQPDVSYDGDDFEIKHYQPEEGWAAYV